MPKGKRIKKAESSIPSLDDVRTTDEWEEWVVRNASYFTLTFKQGPGRVVRVQFNKLRQAIRARDGDPRGMIYAVTDGDRSIMIGPKQYDKFLKLRGEQEEV